MGGSRRWIFLGRSKTLVDFCAVFVGGFVCGFFWLAKNVGEFRWWIFLWIFWGWTKTLVDFVCGFRLWIFLWIFFGGAGSAVNLFVDFFSPPIWAPISTPCGFRWWIFWGREIRRKKTHLRNPHGSQKAKSTGPQKVKSTNAKMRAQQKLKKSSASLRFLIHLAPGAAKQEFSGAPKNLLPMEV